MLDRKGLFIVIEDTDSSSILTQIELLKDRLIHKGYEVSCFNFPQLNSPSSYFVQRYFNSSFGAVDKLNPYSSSIFFTLDRYDAVVEIQKAINDGKIVIANRFTAYDMAHQGIKFKHPEERRGFFIWLDNLEYQTFEIPRPNLSIILRFTSDSLLNHSSSSECNYSENIVEVYDDICQLFPKDFTRIDCTRSGRLIDDGYINNIIWEKVTPLLPLISKDGNSINNNSSAIDSKPYTTKKVNKSNIDDNHNVNLQINNASSLLLNKILSSNPSAKITIQDQQNYYNNSDYNQYFVPNNLDDHAKTLYKNFLQKNYQLRYKLKKELHNKLVIPIKLNNNDKDRLNTKQKIINDILHPLVPAAISSTININISRDNLYDLINGLYNDELLEAKLAGDIITKNTKDSNSDLTKYIDQSNINKNIITDTQNDHKNIKILISELLPQKYSDKSNPVTLINYWPRNECDIVSDIIYEYSDQPFSDLVNQLEHVTYDQKINILQAFLKKSINDMGIPSTVFEKAHYSWELMCDYGIFSNLQYLNDLENCLWQPLTPRYGYDIPDEVITPELDEYYEDCFNISLELFSSLQKSGYEVEAQYVTLFGHRMRCQITYNFCQAFNIFQKLNILNFRPEYRNLLQAMHQLLIEAHPIISSSITIYNSSITNKKIQRIP